MGLLQLIFVLGLVVITTVAACAAAKMIRRGPAGSIVQAIGALLDWAGMFVLFCAANLTLGVAAILLVRSLTTRFITLYGLESLLLIVLSGAQAFVFQMWWKRD
ncbi:MAG TPA: hypothetical protein VGK48_20680 [Terriglobia bacterium]|jgi:hypothetical protein